ncbi:MAG TPA: bifunctional diguanylate cyclase/phosphodiesterase [Steroidobacteraceae bacterium]|nr:bifunctional diguanylate cyclase/phosphodiesterase [Steroidobacteraceae bacterium]
MNSTESKDTSATGRHDADLALMRLGHELRRRVRDRVALGDVLREIGERMQSDAVLLWMPYCRLRLPVAVHGTEVSVAVATEFDGIADRVASAEERKGQAAVVQGEDARGSRLAACRLLVVPVDTGSARFPAWLVFARELTSPRFDTWTAVNAQVQGLRLARRLMREFDPDTGHLSRRGLRTVMTGCERGCGALVIADLDGLRPLNHTHGADVGDMVIAAFARLMAPPLLPANTLVSRFDGARFVLLIPDIDAAAACNLASQLQSELERVEIKDQEDFPRLSFSAGVAEYNLADEPLPRTLLSADMALRMAKERGRGRIEIHQSNDASMIRRQDQDYAAHDLRDALREGQLELFTQPIVALRDRKHPLGFELLLRLRGRNGVPGDPARLLAAAQKFQMLPMVDRYVVDKAFSILAPHREVLARQRITMGINVSGQSICDTEFADHFIQELKSSKLPPGCIVVEITEQVAAGNLAMAAEVMRRLRAAGCGIAIDDFGTGANSLAYVHQLPVTRLKIDGSFIREVTTNKKSEAAVRGIVQLARDFVLQTVAEYVESQQQSEVLRKLGVDFGQGFLFGKPEPLDATVATLVERESAVTTNILSVG